MKKTITERQIKGAIEDVILEYFKSPRNAKAPQQPVAQQANAEDDDDEKYNQVSLGYDPKVRSGKEWHEKGGNFPIVRDGKTFYVSRSVAVSFYAFCQNRNGEWCVLANKRVPGAPNNRGKWNVICGYLDYGETAEEAALRECWEECGLRLDPSVVKQQGVNSKSENVTIRFAAVLSGTTDNYPLSMDNCEPGEVTSVAWVPLQYVERLQWAFGQGHKILPQAKTSIGYDSKTMKCNSDLTYKINALKSELRGSNPYAFQLFTQILQELKDYKMV